MSLYCGENFVYLENWLDYDIPYFSCVRIFGTYCVWSSFSFYIEEYEYQEIPKIIGSVYCIDCKCSKLKTSRISRIISTKLISRKQQKWSTQ